MKMNRMVILLLIFSFIPASSFSENLPDYLVLQDIGSYKLEAPQKVIGGYIGGPRVFDGAGVIAPIGHFYLDHSDKTYEAYYEDGSTLSSSTVQVTKHSGSDSDKWLLHEVEDGYRDGEMERLGLLTKGARLRDINGNKFISLRGSGYSWISNKVVVDISYTDLYGNKPEPLEVVQAYLQKFPSTISSSLVLDNNHDIQWIKDEMERRLWLCDKWYMQFQLGKVAQKDMLKELVDHMTVFLNYREKYYGISAKDERNLLSNYLYSNNGTAIKAKLTEYKTWWTTNKTKTISIQ